jgi:hypothetical protein
VALFYYALAPYRRLRVARRDPRAFMTAPGPGQLGWWALVSLSAGVAEELAYRGVASAILLYAGLPAVGRGPGRERRVRPSRTRTAAGSTSRQRSGIGALLHVLVLASHSLWPAMAAHAVYDFFAGMSYSRMVREAERGGA